MLTHLSFPDFVRERAFVVVHFWADWNAYDAEMREILERRIPHELLDKVVLASFDTGPPEHHQLCRDHDVIGLPFIELYRNGKLAGRLVGQRSPEEVAGWLSGFAG